MTEDQQLRVGEVARATGLTVRALHHYDTAGLVRPSGRSQAGHRLYGMQDVARLEQVAALRRAGLGLEDIAGALASGDVRAALERRLTEVEQELAAGAHLRSRLRTAIKELEVIEEKLAQRADAVGEERIKQVEQEWARLFAELEEHRTRGTDPADPAVQTLAERGDALFAEFHGGDPELAAHASKAWKRSDSAEVSQGMVTAELWSYFGAVQAARGKRLPGG
jgi:DNA-binding transcriptional MerR regulator